LKWLIIGTKVNVVKKGAKKLSRSVLKDKGLLTLRKIATRILSFDMLKNSNISANISFF